MKEIVVTVKPQFVNSKNFAKEFVRQVYEMMIEFNHSEGEAVPRMRHRYNAGVREELVELVSCIMEDLTTAGKIKSNWEIISDHRNNSEHDFSNKVCHMLVKFTQTDCLNTTSFDFIIQG